VKTKQSIKQLTTGKKQNNQKTNRNKKQSPLELLLLKILTIKKKHHPKITQHSPMCFLKTIIYDITILYHKHRTPPPYTNNKCNRNKGLLLTKLDKRLSFSYYVLQLSCKVGSGYKCQLHAIWSYKQWSYKQD
jgi:hypothetical protein